MNFSLLQKLYWQAVMYFEAQHRFGVDSHSATQIAQSLHTRSRYPFLEKLTFRSKYLDEDRKLQTALNQIQKTYVRGAILLCVLCLLGGVMAAGLALQNHSHAGKVVNFYGILLGFLGSNAVMLLLWLVLLWLRGNNLSGFIIGKALKLWCAKRSHSPHLGAALAAFMDYWGNQGRFGFYALSHAAWSAFFVGILLALVFYFSVGGYQFEWQSTLLNDAQLQQISHYLTWLPQQLGAPLAVDEPRAMALLLLAALLVYGLLPRLVLWLACRFWAWHQAKRYLPNFDLPYYQNLARALENPRSANVIVDADNQFPTAKKSPPNAAYNLAHGDIKNHFIDLNQWLKKNPHWDILAVDMPKLPPKWDSIDWRYARDLGLCASRDSQARAMEQAIGAAKILLLYRLASVPDRGVARQLDAFANAAGKLGLGLLIEQQNLPNRQQEWLQLAKAKHIAPVFFLDADFKLLEIS